MPTAFDYFVAPFAPDGELVGMAGRALSELSPKWLGFCRELLASQGSSFRRPIPLPSLQHVTLQLTSGSGAALVSFFVHDEPASSAVALPGSDAAAESELLRSFVESMRRVPLVQQAASTTAPFAAAVDLPQRPLYVVIPWGNPRISEADQELVQELDDHLGAALLCRPPAA